MFCLLYVGMVYIEVDQAVISYSLLFFAAATALFFLVSIGKNTIYLYLGITLLFFIHAIVILDRYSMFTILLFLYLVITATFTLNRKHIITYVMVNLLLSILLSYGNVNRLIAISSVSLLIYFLVLTVNRMKMERDEQKEIYDTLSGEYRQLKRLNLRIEEATRLEERTKIARDIHDSVGHRLTALMMKLEMLSIQNPTTDYQELKHMANESLEETREAVQALQVETNEGLATVVHLIRKLESESHILVQFTMKQGVLSARFSNEKSVVLYRVIQEALTNAMRHAQAREVQIILGKSAKGDISFEISNKLHEAKTYEFGFGLTNMNERIDKVDGILHVFQTEKQFVVSGTIPSGDKK